MAVSIEDESNNPCMKQMSDASNQTSATPNCPCGSIADASAETEESAAGISFNPPLYLQRYKLVIDFVEKTNARKVVDVGCSECGLVLRLKQVSCTEEIIGVDVDAAVLSAHSGVVQPLSTDYMMQRERPLRMQLLHGSVAEPDARIMEADVIAIIEVVEHLEEATLERVPHTVFGSLMPQHVIVSTPNSEYNILFPNFSGFRHWDHKFEWTRREFSQWCTSICNTYPYSVELTGLGEPTEGSEHVGFCTQVAIFTRDGEGSKADKVWQLQRGAMGEPYAQVAEGVFPVASPVPRMQKLQNEIRYCVSYLVATSRWLGDETRLNDDESWTFPLSDLMRYPSIQKYFNTVDDIRAVLSDGPQQDLLLDASGDHVTVPYSERSTSSEEEVDDSASSCTVLCAPVSADEKEDWDVL